MDNRAKIASILLKGGTVFMKDDFYDAAIRLVPTGSGEKVYIKHVGTFEKEIDASEDIVYQIMQGGIFINELEYRVY